MAGLPGTGKSTLARALATRVDGLVLDKDRVRAALFSEPWIEYSQQQDDFCVEILLQAAAYLLAAPHVPPFLFLDGRVFASRYQVERAVEWATGAGCRLKIIHTICSDKTAYQRLQAGHHLASNRNYDLYLQVPSIKEYWLFDTRDNPERLRLEVRRRYGRRSRRLTVGSSGWRVFWRTRGGSQPSKCDAGCRHC